METVVGESGVCSFSENWRRHGTPVLRLSSPSRLGQGIVAWAQRQTQTHQASRKRRLLFINKGFPRTRCRLRGGRGWNGFGGRMRILAPSGICEPIVRYHCCVRTRAILLVHTKSVLPKARSNKPTRPFIVGGFFLCFSSC